MKMLLTHERTCIECKRKAALLKEQQAELSKALDRIERGLTMDGVNILRRLLLL